MRKEEANDLPKRVHMVKGDNKKYEEKKNEKKREREKGG